MTGAQSMMIALVYFLAFAVVALLSVRFIITSWRIFQHEGSESMFKYWSADLSHFLVIGYVAYFAYRLFERNGEPIVVLDRVLLVDVLHVLYFGTLVVRRRRTRKSDPNKRPANWPEATDRLDPRH